MPELCPPEALLECVWARPSRCALKPPQVSLAEDRVLRGCSPTSSITTTRELLRRAHSGPHPTPTASASLGLSTARPSRLNSDQVTPRYARNHCFYAVCTHCHHFRPSGEKRCLLRESPSSFRVKLKWLTVPVAATKMDAHFLNDLQACFYKL